MGEGGTTERRRKRRWGTAPAAAAAAPPPAPAAEPEDKKAKILAMQESIKARLAAARQQKQGSAVPVPAGTTSTASNAAALPAADKVQAMKASIQARLQAARAQAQVQPATSTPAFATEFHESRPVKRAKHFDLDMSVTGPTFEKTTTGVTSDTTKAQNAAAPKKKVNPYLAHTTKDEEAGETEVVDERLARAGKDRRRHKAMKFVEPGMFQKIAERKREKVAKAQEAGFISGRKVGHTVHSAGMAEIYTGSASTSQEETVETLAPRWDAHPDTKMPLAVEWWDVELLPSKLKKKVAAVEAQVLSKQNKAAFETRDGDDKETSKEEEATEGLRTLCFENAKLSYSKTSELVQHIVPVKPPSADTGPAKEPVLHLTKKERRRQHKLKRREKQREQQDLQAAGLIPAPEPRLTLQNFIRVLGDQAFVDPSQMEKKVMEQVEARKQAHIERNDANKLTKEQRSAKRAKKLEEDTSQGVHVAVFYVKDMSHPYHRAKVDLNAQQFNITGGVVESQNPSMACVVVEGGPKAIKRYIRLMTVRMKWTGPDDVVDSDEEDDDKEEEKATKRFNPENSCELVWEGMVVKRLFNGFVFQTCESPDQARRVLKAKGVSHYWDQVTAHASGHSNKLGLRMANDSDGEENPYKQAADDDEDIVMRRV
eukprot:scaffold12113_cov159-Amphora_coffeaeformis.AAC.8